MFETSRPQPAAQGRRLFYEVLPVSLSAHAAVVFAVIVAGAWNVEFPDASPKQYMAFRLAAEPPPPPPPPPPPKAQQAVQKEPVKVPEEIVAPTEIPDTVPLVQPEVVKVEASGAMEGGVEGGVEGGEVGGILGGTVGGVVAVEPQQPPPPDGRVHVERDQPLNLGILSKAYPLYPAEAVSRGWEDSLVVRYVIGKNGRVKDVTIIQPPLRKEFERPTLRAIRMWRFRPLIQEGEAKEVVHELTVNYRLTRGR